ncbi:TonB-dependent receptor [Erythrobacteraceae bacterium CFH 75059]|uniref:TonB-dependent receptor domain-containing protein n=1 Tax=Qipengyuania thermophila TaxID=2509361 RepID=UPI00101FFBD7|nr:TonB-dependent receptor [Qipengyuania thermophila]TCD06386.1 TonB-dependent receptor [Erythrobacteraceae bacterium CFH 75059]
MPAAAQRVDEDPVRQAQDGFGISVGNERAGVYNAGDVRGFSPVAAGNVRLEDLYIDRAAGFTDRLTAGSTVRVGLTAQDTLFAAPTGIADFRLRPVGSEPVLAVLAGVGPFGGGRVELDAQVPLAGDRLGMTAGLGVYADELPAGNGGFFISQAAALHWRSGADVTVSPFWSRIDGLDREAQAIYVAGGPSVPPRVPRRRFVGADWTDARSVSTNAGVVARGSVGPWSLAAGLFRSSQENRTAFSDLVRAAGDGDEGVRRTVIAERDRRQAATSGEVRATRVFADGERRHRLALMLRGRERANRYGGGAVLDLGSQPAPAPLGPDEPDFAFGPQTHEQIRQWTPGVAYGLQWRRLGSLQLGVQRTDYRKQVRAPASPASAVRDRAWLLSAMAASDPSRPLVVYGGYTRGLEESGTAPDSAANRGEVLPAIFTRQIDGGVRWAMPGGMRLVAGAFSISKPYFAADENNVFVELGEVRHQGFEFSLTGSPVPRLSLVAGAVLMDPEVSGAPVEEGRIGRRPVGQEGTLVSVSANYDLAAVEGLTLTAGLRARGERYGDRQNQVRLPAVATLEAGLRYRFALGEAPAMLRLQVTNLTNVFEWRPVSSGAYEFNAPRTFTLSLSADV